MRYMEICHFLFGIVTIGASYMGPSTISMFGGSQAYYIYACSYKHYSQRDSIVQCNTYQFERHKYMTL
jgi:hypothetical protein